jgi:Holliday junction resolvasome RuvABC endonuclease subunit
LTVTVVGIDPSLTATGMADNHDWCDTIGWPGITTQRLPQRITEIDRLAGAILDLVRVDQPDLVVIEQPAFSRSVGGAVERHALWWLIVRALHQDGTPVAVAVPGAVKRYATGKGGASKGAVIDAIARRLPQYVTGGDDNRADAVTLAAMGADHLGHPLTPMPATHRTALDGVDWPVDLLKAA